MDKTVLLIVEDQPDLRKLLAVTMSLDDFEIHEADNGHGALKLVDALHPDVVLLDVMMPGGLDGFQVCERIKSNPATRDTRVVMLTARAQARDVETAFACGADGYLSKPFSPLELIGKVQELLARKQQPARAGSL